LESILNAALEGEMDAHLIGEERQMSNRRVETGPDVPQ